MRRGIERVVIGLYRGRDRHRDHLALRLDPRTATPFLSIARWFRHSRA